MFIFLNQYIKLSSVVLLMSIWIGCQTDAESPGDSEEKRLEVIVEHSAGDEYISEREEGAASRYMPYPFNMAYIRGYESERTQCIVLSQQLSKRRRLEVTPIALFSMTEYGELNNYIIVIPKDEDLQSIPVHNFSDLTTKYVSIKNIIDNWMLDRCGFNCSRKEGWGGESAGLKAIENLKASQP